MKGRFKLVSRLAVGGAATLGIAAACRCSARNRFRALEQRLRSEDLKRWTLQSLPAHIAVVDWTGEILAVNEAWTEFARANQAGDSPSVAVGANYLAACRKAASQGDALADEALAGIQSVMAGRLREFSLEYPCHSPVEQRWFVMTAVRFGPDGEGGAVITHTNITERKQIEEALRKSEEKFRAVFEQAAVGMGRVCFSTSRWIDVNDAFCRMLGYTADELRTISWPEMTHPDDLEWDLASFRRMAAGELSSYTVEKRFLHKQGHPVWARLSLSAVRDRQGHPVYEIAVIEDITARKQVEEALRAAKDALSRANERLEQTVRERTAKLQETVDELELFSYTITHDMRAPLRAMKGFGEILLEECDGSLSPPRRDFLRRIADAAERMDHLIADALKFSRAVRTRLELKAIDPSPLLQGIIESYPQLQRPHAEIEIEQPMPLVMGNEAGLTQCFSNLLDNAVKFVHPGVTPRVRVWGTQPSTPGERVRLWFEDNGVGIKPEYHEKIFVMFQKLDRSYEGTGIGLALVRKVANRMGGEVGVESEPGRGSRFWLELNPSIPH